MPFGSPGGPKNVTVTGGDIDLQQGGQDVGPSNPLSVSTLTGAVQVDVDSGDSTITYLGFAVAGTATSLASWRIARVTQSGDATSIDWADGDILFNNIWDNRESLSYS